MNRREKPFMVLAVSAALVAGLVEDSRADMNQVKKPNVVFILADDLGWGEPGCYGNALNETPNVDAMAAAGMRFTSAYASSTVCRPSRAGLMTGQTPPRNGITDYLRPDTRFKVGQTELRFAPADEVIEVLPSDEPFFENMVGASLSM